MRGNNRNRENTVESRNDFERLREIIFITVNRESRDFLVERFRLERKERIGKLRTQDWHSLHSRVFRLVFLCTSLNTVMK